MATTTIFCPACNNKLRVPEELMAQPVECPKCGAAFTAPPPTSRQSDDVSVIPVESDEFVRTDRGEWSPVEGRPQIGQTKTALPALLMLIAAGLNLVINLYGLISTVVNPGAVRKMGDQLSQAMGVPPMPVDAAKLNMVAAGLFLVVSLAQLVAAVAMMRRRWYALAMMGAFLSIINCNNICCLLSIPVGIWAFIVLLQPDVKASFS
jgi:hypothetical protein